MSEKVSVIIPVYNVEKYLNRCVDSVINQTYKNLEIILVDDGSPDNCSRLCDEYAEKDDRVNVIHKENGWLSSARNAGMDIMTGDYVTFIDSDDYVKENMIERMVELMKEHNADVVQVGYCSDENEFYNDKTDFSEKIIEGNDNIKAFIDGIMYVMAWGKLYHSKTIADFRFLENLRCVEDEEFGLRFYKNVNKTVLCDEKMYFYFQENQNSIMKNIMKNREKELLRLDTFYNVYTLAEEREKECKWLYEYLFQGKVKKTLFYLKHTVRSENFKLYAEFRNKLVRINKIKVLTSKLSVTDKATFMFLNFIKNGETLASMKKFRAKLKKRK